MTPPLHLRRIACLGFTLVEIMVGMVVALLALLVVMQVFGSFEGQKRMTTGTADVQTSGVLALQSVVTETQMAGYALSAFDIRVKTMTCTDMENRSEWDGDSYRDDRDDVSTAPVWVEDSKGGGSSDAITVRYGTTLTGGLATKVDRNNYDGSSANLPVHSGVGCAAGDMAILSNGGDYCELLSVEDVDPDATPRPLITFAASEPASLFSSSLVNDNAYVMCIGSEFRQVTFEVDDATQTLMRNGEEVASNVVNMQIQYGISDEPSTSRITAWVDAIGNWEKLDLADGANRRGRIKAVRVAIVVRSPLKERDPVSFACTQPDDPAGDGASTTGVCAWMDWLDPLNESGAKSAAPEIDLSGLADWDQYRYRVFETIIPLRNIVWAKGGV
ncbi:MAG: hypothetical protein GX573_14365 [Chloroflexi bacterium]|nr:hypothetical protein [Chloroflexota bacterium]